MRHLSLENMSLLGLSFVVNEKREVFLIETNLCEKFDVNYPFDISVEPLLHPMSQPHY